MNDVINIPDFRSLTPTATRQMCRLCLTENNDIQNRTDDWTEVIQLHEQIVGESLLVSNILSTLCCQPCLEWLRHTTLTIQQFKNSVRFWSNYLEWQVVETKTIEHKDMSGNTLDKTHPSRSSDDCSEITNGDKNIGEHHAISENTFCSICHQHFTDLFRHSKRSHPMVELECAYCELKFESKAAIRKHFKVDHRQMNRLTCDICHKSNLSKQYYERHRESHNRSLDNLLGCDECDKSFHGKTRLAVHKKAVHLDDQVQCPECGKLFRNIVRLKGHMIRHREKSVACPECPVKFWLTKEMKEHVRTVHRKERKFVCESCGKGYLMNAQLKKHISNGLCSILVKKTDNRPPRSHKRIPLVCHICGRSCKMVKTMQLHYEKDHPTESWEHVLNRICPVCVGQFETTQLLAEHCWEIHKQNGSLSAKSVQADVSKNTDRV